MGRDRDRGAVGVEVGVGWGVRRVGGWWELGREGCLGGCWDWGRGVRRMEGFWGLVLGVLGLVLSLTFDGCLFKLPLLIVGNLFRCPAPWVAGSVVALRLLPGAVEP